MAFLVTARVFAQSPPQDAVEVIGVTPAPGLAVPRDRFPGNVRVIDAGEYETRGSTSLPDFLAHRIPGVSVNETQGNPLQPSLNYRGFTGSPLLGAPQGLSMFVDGARVNEVFGDVVNWDLLPHNAIASTVLIPGSNPLYGLNTLGGAISLRTKSGATHPGTRMEAQSGTFGREDLQFEHGRNLGAASLFLAGTRFRDDGWRDHSPSASDNLFGKFSHQGERHTIDISLLAAHTNLTGNGLVPGAMYSQSRRRVYTVPDNTRNRATMATLNASWTLSDDMRLTSTLYQRRVRTRTLNGDVNNGFENDAALDGAAGANGNLGFNQDTGANNRSDNSQQATGASLQWSLVHARHRLALGLAHDRGHADFEQNATLGVFDTDRTVRETGAATPRNRLQGRTQSHALFISEHFEYSRDIHLSASMRYNRARVTTRDLRRATPPNLDGDYHYAKLNPALGLTWRVLPAATVYGGFNQGNRVPSPIELGCADRANPCTLPNAMASDPFRKQVVTRTLETGIRGSLGDRWRWHAGVFRAESRDDILFVGTTTSAGYFTNFGKTRRDGLELSLAGQTTRWQWDLGYSQLRATFQSAACLLAQNNSQRGQYAECPSAGDDLIHVAPGNRMPGLPVHTLKLAIGTTLDENTRIGGEIAGFSSQLVRGNENNAHRAGSATVNGNTRVFEGSGTTAGYALVNLHGLKKLAGGWEAFARVSNLFNKRHETGGMLAENAFDASGAFQPNSDNWIRDTFVAPGAPRAGWIGLRYRFGSTRAAL